MNNHVAFIVFYKYLLNKNFKAAFIDFFGHLGAAKLL